MKESFVGRVALTCAIVVLAVCSATGQSFKDGIGEDQYPESEYVIAAGVALSKYAGSYHFGDSEGE